MVYDLFNVALEKYIYYTSMDKVYSLPRIMAHKDYD